MALKPPFSSLYYCSEVPGPKASSSVPLSLTVLPLPRSSLPVGIGGRHHRRLNLVTPQPGDASKGQPIDIPPSGSHHMFDSDFDFDFGQRSGTGRYISPQSWADTCFSKKTKASPYHPRGTPDDVTFSEQLTWHSLCWGCDILSHALISWHVVQSHGHNLTPLELFKLTLYLSKMCAPNHCFIHSSHSLYCSSFPAFSAIFILSFALPIFIQPDTQRYDFSPSMALPFNSCMDITAWACLFSLHSRSSSSFLCFSLSELLAWVGIFLGFLSPFPP